MIESIFPELRETWVDIVHRKPDIVIVEPITRACYIVEIKVCYDLYFEYSYNEKYERYTPVCNVLESDGWKVELVVLCFGSLGCMRNDVWRGLRKLGMSKSDIKDLMKWCSISNLIMANYIWRHRVKKLF